jgi:hypothetical protein
VGSKLHGTFRVGDLRWSKTTHTITHVILNPDTPPLYQIDDNGKIAYTIYQLQVVKPNEIKPTSDKDYAQEIVDKKKVKNVIEYKVRWEKGDFTWMPRQQAIKELPDMVKEYELKVKQKK